MQPQLQAVPASLRLAADETLSLGCPEVWGHLEKGGQFDIRALK